MVKCSPPDPLGPGRHEAHSKSGLWQFLLWRWINPKGCPNNLFSGTIEGIWERRCHFLLCPSFPGASDDCKPLKPSPRSPCFPSDLKAFSYPRCLALGNLGLTMPRVWISIPGFQFLPEAQERSTGLGAHPVARLEQKCWAYKICSVRSCPSDIRNGPFWKVSWNSWPTVFSHKGGGD